MTKILIGLTAAARSGKDTAADYLIEEQAFIKYSFASPIKDFFDSLFNWGMEHREGQYKEVETLSPVIHEHELLSCLMTTFPKLDLALTFKVFNLVFNKYQRNYQASMPDGYATYQYDISPRVAYQLLGTEFGRSLAETLWLDLAKQRWELIRVGAVDPDCTGLIIPDVRFQNEADWIREAGGHLIHIQRGTKEAVASHASEGGVNMDARDYRLDNNGTVEELFSSARAIVHRTKELAALGLKR